MIYIYIKPLPPGATSGGLDFYLGTLDREDLQSFNGLDRFVNCDLGMEWVRGLFTNKEGVPWHPATNMAVYE